jgi:hypothetical protein
MTILSVTKNKSGIFVYIVSKSNEIKSGDRILSGKFVNEKDIQKVIDHNADVYTETGELLLRFRKHVLPLKNIQTAYENMIQFAKNKTGARGAASGSSNKDVKTNPRIASNILGYYDSWSIFYRHMIKSIGLKAPPTKVRGVTKFTAENPEKWQKIIPFIEDIDSMYKKLVPDNYNFQKKCADETAFRISKTAFSTVTTNLNLQTAIHKDSGNLKGSFGNLVVIENGKYEGGYTCYPEYGIGVDVRTGDFLAMNIHIYHGNTKIKKKRDDAERLSIVCYLRKSLYEKTRGSTKADVQKCINAQRYVMHKYGQLKSNKPIRNK